MVNNNTGLYIPTPLDGIVGAVEWCGGGKTFLPSLPSLPPFLEGYEWPIGGVFCFVFLLILMDLSSRRTMNRRRLANPNKKNPSLPTIMPFPDPLLIFFMFFYNIFTGNTYRLRHPGYVCERNMTSEKENNGCKCRQFNFLGWPMVVTWDADHFREVSTNTEDYGKVLGLFKSFDEISKRSILFVEGQEWKDQKRLIHPAFQFTHVKNQIPKFNTIANRFVTQLGSIDGPVEMMPWTSKATLDGLSMAGFGLDMGALLNKNNKAYEVYSTTMSQFEDPMNFIPLYHYLPTEKNKKWEESTKLYVKYLSELVGRKRLLMLEEERTGVEREGKDILDVLIAARDVDENTGLSEEELIHNVNVFYLAGHETSSSTVAFATHMLAEHPEVQEKVYQEIQKVIGDRAPSNEDFPSLKYTSAFLKEVQRLYPTAVGIIRKTTKNVVLGGYHVDEGTMVMLSTYTTHRHPGYWERPDDFWPERFFPENSKGRHPFAYTPFSAGTRACIGKQFALVEMKILLIHLVQTFKVKKDPEQKGPFVDGMGLVLRPPIGAKVILEKRK